MENLTPEELNLKGHVKALEEILDRINTYLDNHKGICRGSPCHLEIKLMLRKAQWGDQITTPTFFEM